MGPARTAVVALAALVCVVLQLSVLPHLAVAGVVPDLALLLVIGAALVRGPSYAAVLGFGSGLLLDIAPPADHTLGRWALTFVLVGYLVGLVRIDAARSVVGTVVAVAAASFIGTSVFALSGMVLGETGVSVTRALQVVGIAVLYDVAVALVVLPTVRRLVGGADTRRRVVPVRVGAR